MYCVPRFQILSPDLAHFHLGRIIFKPILPLLQISPKILIAKLFEIVKARKMPILRVVFCLS